MHLALQPTGAESNDDPTSSSGNETPSDCDHDRPLTHTIPQARAPSPPPDVDRDIHLREASSQASTSRKQLRIGLAVSDAWHSTVSIWRAPSGKSRGHWAGLVKHLTDVRAAVMAQPDLLQQRTVAQCIRVLSCFIVLHGIDRRMRDKEYIQSLEKSEAKAVIRFNRIFPLNDVVPLADKLDVTPYAIDIAYRFARFALRPPGSANLNLRHLDLGSRGIDIDMAAYAELCGVQLSEVESLDLSENDLAEVPAWALEWWLDNPEPTALCHLELGSAPSKRFLPLSIQRSPLRSITWYRRSRTMKLNINPGPWKRRAPTSLVEACLTVLLQHRVDLPEEPPYSRYNSWTLCDVCRSLCRPDEQRKRISTGRVARIFKGRACDPCAAKVSATDAD